MYLHGASISHRDRISLYMRLERSGWFFNTSQGNNIIIDAFRVYLHGASISHRERRSLYMYMRFECIRMVLQYLSGYEDQYRYF